MPVDGKTHDIIRMFKIKGLGSIFRVENDPSGGCVIHYITIPEIVYIIPGVETPIAMHVFQRHILHVFDSLSSIPRIPCGLTNFWRRL